MRIRPKYLVHPELEVGAAYSKSLTREGLLLTVVACEYANRTVEPYIYGMIHQINTQQLRGMYGVMSNIILFHSVIFRRTPAIVACPMDDAVCPLAKEYCGELTPRTLLCSSCLRCQCGDTNKVGVPPRLSLLASGVCVGLFSTHRINVIDGDDGF